MEVLEIEDAEEGRRAAFYSNYKDVLAMIKAFEGSGGREDEEEDHEYLKTS